VGAHGQLGTALQSVLDGVVPLDRSQIDIGDAESVNSRLSDVRPEVVINAAAYNFVDKAESEPDAAHRVNALGPKLLAEFCESHNATLVHVSTDYVFTGRTGDRPWTEADEPAPVSVYATSKRAGEDNVRRGCARHFVVRTCGLYGNATSAGKGNFVKTMLRLSAERDELRIVDDQRCTPTSTDDLAGWIAALISTQHYGLYHATNTGDCTWCEFARKIFHLAGRRVTVSPITTAEFGAAAARPTYSVLDCTKLQAALGRTFRPWQEALADYVHAGA
jgi:dTDP-4-dehydrorhamnose reductase